MATRPFRLPQALAVRILCRTFFLQASWNFEGLQDLGALNVLAPALRHFYRDRPKELALAYKRHLRYFNTHPYMASPVLGIMLGLEERRSRNEEGDLGVQDFREMVMGPYAAMGDTFFWGGVRPLAAAVALVFAVQGYLWAPLLFLVLFNIPHLWMRIPGFLEGYRDGLAVVEKMQRRRFPDRAVRLKEGMIVLLGGVSAYLVVGFLKQEHLGPAWGLAVLPVMAALGWLARKGVSVLTIVLGAATLVFLFPLVA